MFITNPLFGGIAAVLAAGMPVGAQEGVVEPGARVRFLESMSQESGWIHGTVMAWDGESLVVEPEGGMAPLTLIPDQIQSLEIYRGRQSWGALRGGVIGLFGGAAIGAGIGYALGDSGVDYDHRGFTTFVAAIGGAGVGLLVGLLAGNAIKTHRWERIPTERLAVSVVPAGWITLGASLDL